MTEQPQQQKQKPGRPARVSKTGLIERPTAHTERKGNTSHSITYIKKQLANGDIRYYKKERVYNRVQERKRRTILNAKYRPVKRAKISNIKKALSEKYGQTNLKRIGHISPHFYRVRYIRG